jgi:hypothetical protein
MLPTPDPSLLELARVPGYRAHVDFLTAELRLGLVTFGLAASSLEVHLRGQRLALARRSYDTARSFYGTFSYLPEDQADIEAKLERLRLGLGLPQPVEFA